MKAFLLLTLALFFSCNGQAYYEDHPEVEALVNTGYAQIYRGSSACPRSYGDETLTDRLGAKEGYHTLCVKHVQLPANVLSEVMLMEEHELENESDYDSRVTKLYVFKQDKFTTKWGVTAKEILKLAKAFNIPAKMAKDARVSSFVGVESSVDQFAGLYVGDAYDTSNKTHDFITGELRGRQVLQISFGDGVELYPGGGFGVTHYFFIMDGKIVYVKHSYWDA